MSALRANFPGYTQFRAYLEENGYDTSQLGLKQVLDPETGSVHSEKDVGKEKITINDPNDVEKVNLEEKEHSS